MAKTLMWKGESLETPQEIVAAMRVIQRWEEAWAFRLAWQDSFPNETEDTISANIGFLCGYNHPPEMARLLTLFKVRHPVFGTFIPTINEAWEFGVKNGIGAQKEPDVQEPEPEAQPKLIRRQFRNALEPID